jgi:uncharacterized protein (DUF433 family)
VTAAPNEYIDVREGGFYVSGTRIGLDVIVDDFQSGKSPEAIFKSYPSIGSLAKTYGVITFILEHPDQIASYIADQNRLWEEIETSNPLPADMLDRFLRARELLRKSA